ncbi:hypothetical protein ACXGPR_005768, partial [Escherichia coli]
CSFLKLFYFFDLVLKIIKYYMKKGKFFLFNPRVFNGSRVFYSIRIVTDSIKIRKNSIFLTKNQRFKRAKMALF